ncbi:MAG TPA: glycosyltransferase [Mycobacteriales bacterium]|nr:glycosyltransferase [Mycobacteriales bacterium]
MSTSSCVCLVVVTYNSAAVLPAFLDALPAGLAGVDDWRLVVVDNASTDGSPEIVAAARPDAQVVRLDGNRGYAAGVNAGAAVAPPGWPLLVLNPDLRLRPGTVRALLAEQQRSGAGIVVPQICDEDGRTAPSLRRWPSLARLWGESLLGGGRAGRLGLGELIVDRDRTAWRAGSTGPAARRCSSRGTATTTPGRGTSRSSYTRRRPKFCWRALRCGRRTRYTPAAVVDHRGGEAEVSPRLRPLLVRNRLEFYARHHRPLATALFRVGLATNELVRVQRSQGRPAHRAALRALRSRATPAAPARARGYLCFSAQDWWYHNRAHSDFQLMRRVARDEPVLLANSIGMRLPLPGRSSGAGRRIARKARSIAKGVRRPLPDTPGFRVMTPLMLPLYGSPLLRAVNSWLVRTQVRIVARAIGLRRPVVMVTLPTAWDVAPALPRRALVYNRSDKHSAFDEANARVVRRLERELLTHADRVFYVSSRLQAEDAPVVGDRAVFLDHGVDAEHFRRRGPEEEPAELRRIPHPRIGFFGGLDDYLVDVALLERVATELPHAQLVLIGDATCPMDDLVAHDNVHWLGFRRYEDIPRYGSGFDVALMPWLANEWIESCNPIKLKEYLALGLPVVTTAYPDAERYRDVVGVAADGREFVRLVEQALVAGAGGAEQRRAAVAATTWDAVAARLRDSCESVGLHR